MTKFDGYDLYTAMMSWWAKAKMSIRAFIPRSADYIDVYLRDKSLVRVESFKFINDYYVRDVTAKLTTTLIKVLSYTPYLVGLCFAGSFMFFGRFSKKQRSSLSSKEFLRGSQLLSSDDLARILYKRGKASDLKLDTLPLIKDSETSHILVTGTTKSGKTNCFHTFLPQIRKRSDSAIVVDTTGAFISMYYRPGQDLILNPLDQRSQN